MLFICFESFGVTEQKIMSLELTSKDDVMVLNIPCRLLMIGYLRHNKKLVVPDDIITLCVQFCFDELHRLLTDYEYLLQFSNATDSRMTHKLQLLCNKIRRYVLANGVADNYSLSNNPKKFQNDTLRGKLWRLMLGVNTIKMDSNEYESTMKHCTKYEYIRTVTRLIYTKEHYRDTLDEAQLVRIMNAYCNTNSNGKLPDGIWEFAQIILYTMPELYAYYTFKILVEQHIPTYIHLESGRIGAYYGVELAKQILKIVDKELYHHINPYRMHSFYGPIAMLQTNCQPFDQVLKLWDFMCCFGVHLCPVITVASVITKRKEILECSDNVSLLSNILSLRRWLNNDINADLIIESVMEIICLLKQHHTSLWSSLLNHASNFEEAVKLKRL